MIHQMYLDLLLDLNTDTNPRQLRVRAGRKPL